MKAAQFADAAIVAEKAHDGHQLAQLFAIGGPISQHIVFELSDPRSAKIIQALRKCQGFLTPQWEEICQHYILSAYYLSLANSFQHGYSTDATDAEGKTSAERLSDSFDAMSTTISAFLRYFSSLSSGRWALPLLRILLLNLRWLAIQADAAAIKPSSSSNGLAGNPKSSASIATNSNNNHSDTRTSSTVNKRLEECARQLNKAFTACIADRSQDMDESRKWGIYEVVGMIFKTYFKLKSISLCKNILRAISAGALPPLDQYPRAHQVTFRYYVGVLAFLGEEYAKAEAELDFAFRNCHHRAVRNQELILSYLIPVKLLNGSLPSSSLLSTFPKLSTIYSPFIISFKSGNIKTFDKCFSDPTLERILVSKGTYLAMEKVREACLRTLFKRVWIVRDKNTRMPIHLFRAALQFAGLSYSVEEVEWYLAVLIFKGYIKGYIAHERGILVLSSKDPFPKLGSFTVATT